MLTEYENTPKISVVMPVYNVQDYLVKCLNSLVTQTFRDFELIAVDDGSTDSCPGILRMFAQTYSFIKVLTKENGGQAQARNLGMDHARGEFLCFLDSDDFLAPDYLERLYAAQKETNADIVYCYYYFYYPESDLRVKYPYRCHGVYNRTEGMNLLLHDLQVQSLPWNKLFRLSLFTQAGVRFPTMCFEDLAVMHRVFDRADTVTVINDALYYYTQHAESTLGSITVKKINDFIRAMAMVRISLERRGTFPKYQKSYHALARKTGSWCALYLFKMHWENRRSTGLLINLRRLFRAISHYSGDSFNASAGGELPDVIIPFPPKGKTHTKEQLEENYIR